MSLKEISAPETGAANGDGGPREVDFLLIGGGYASVAAAEAIRLQGQKESVLILSDEGAAPYHRPSLSKLYLRGAVDDTQILFHPRRFYQEQSIELQLNTRVIAVDPARQLVTTESDGQIRFGKLLIATGLAPELLQVPGASLAGVHSLRRKTDCDAIRRSAAKAKRVVVLGGSFLGMEVAMSFIALGIEVTIVHRGDAVLPRLGCTRLSDYFRQYAVDRGVTILLCDCAVRLRGEDRVQEVETASGRRLPCDMVVIAIGDVPETAFLEQSGIDLDQGFIVVDDLLRTSVPNVFAAGDVTNFYDPVFARRRHIEHWDNAIKQGRLAARNMLGQRLRYDEVPYFFSDLGDITFNVLGMTEDADEWIERGTLDEKSFALFYLKNNVPRALFSVGRPAEETRHVEGLVRYRVSLLSVKNQLRDPGFLLDRILTHTVLILQGGGAMGAFECGVVKALEEEGIFADIVAGVSIGALNGAIIAGNPRHASAALEAFWADITVIGACLPSIAARRSSAALMALMYGVPNFFAPRWLNPSLQMNALPWNWTSYYDLSPLKELIAKHVDFPSLKKSPVRLLISAVNVTTARLETFDSYVDELTPDHVIASGSLPPGFPWTIIDGQAYWDGGIVSNSPLDLVIERCGLESKRVFIVDLYADQKPLPKNLMDVMVRRDEIVYAERVRSDLRLQEMLCSYRTLIEEILSFAAPERGQQIKQTPRYIQLMGAGPPVSVTRFVRSSAAGEPPWHDYDFSSDAIGRNQSDGYALVKKTLERERS